jgi:predicted NUDIX family NTP pyrophosphohydrolase
VATAASAGIVLHRAGTGGPQILLVHPGGPFWAGKDEHGWSIPKGEYDPETEDGETAAVREFGEELGQPLPDGPRRELPTFKAGRKTIRAWLVDGDLDTDRVDSNTFELEWPPRSGRIQSFPEVDRAAWFDLEVAATKLHKGQVPLCQLVVDALQTS